MSGWKQPSILSRNRDNLNCLLMILETNKKEGEEYLYYSYKTNDSCSNLLNLKGVALASIGISNSIFCDDYKVFNFTDIKTNLKYKLQSKTFYKYYIVSVIVPNITPDNILLYICNEFIEFVMSFFESFEDSKKYFDILNKYCEVLFYYALTFSLEKKKEDFFGSPLNNIPLANVLFSYNEVNPCFIVKPPLNDNLRTEIIEFINNIYADRSVLQENITLMDPPFYLNGILLTFRGFVIYNSLSNHEFLSLCRTANLYDVYDRTQNCPEILVCEYLFKNEKLDNPVKLINLDSLSGSDTRKRFLATILAQREFAIFISLEIVGKSNCSFDPFFQKRAEDILVGMLKRGFGTIINNELYNFGIKPIQTDLREDEENIFNTSYTESNNNFKNLTIENNQNSNEDNLNKKLNKNSNQNIQRKNSYNSSGSSGKINKNNEKYQKRENTQNSNNINTELIIKENYNSNMNLNSKFKGYLDNETKVNIIQFSCFDDTECVINTTDINANPKHFQEIYKTIFNEYSKIQSNINKLKNRNKQLKLRKIFNYDNVARNYSNFNVDVLKQNENANLKLNYKNEPITKNKSIRENFLRNLNTFKINEYAIKFYPNENIPIWISCKIYEHTYICEETNLDEFSNYKIIFVSYESISPVDIDSFCQDLLINEFFI